MIDSKEIEFDPPETPNVITAPMPNHDEGINAIEDVSYVSAISDLTTPLMTVKKKLLQVGLFPGYVENCYYCASQSNGCVLLKECIQRLMDDRVILFEKIPPMKSSCKSVSQGLKLEDVAVIITSDIPVRITFKGPINITAEPRVAPLIITTLGPIPYSSNRAIPKNYGADVYYHGIKQEPLAVKDENTEVIDPNVSNIVGTSKVSIS